MGVHVAFAQADHIADLLHRPGYHHHIGHALQHADVVEGPEGSKGVGGIAVQVGRAR